MKVNGKDVSIKNDRETFARLNTFFISNIFLSNAKLQLVKNPAKAKQHPEAEILLFENYSFPTPTLSSKNNRRFSKNVQKRQVSLFKRGYMIL